MDTSQALPVGTLLASKHRKYKIKKVLGQGGFGITYLATSRIMVENISTEASFCIKEHYIQSMNERRGTSVIISNPNNIVDVKNSVAAFLAEARRLNSLSRHHDNIVRVNEVFEANDTAYYVMQYIDGQKLSAYVKAHDGGCLPETEALQLTAEVGEALSFLHKNMLTHLDVKPDNIMLNEDNTPVLIDFGLAKHYDIEGRPTSSIKVMGLSEGYAPIEQYVGITEFTPEADVYALAATLCFMLTGQHPPVSTKMNSQVITQMLEGHASSSTIVAVQHAMERLKEMRTHSIEAFLEELQPKEPEEPEPVAPVAATAVKPPVVEEPEAGDPNATKHSPYHDGILDLEEDDNEEPKFPPQGKGQSGGSTVISQQPDNGNKKYYMLGIAAAVIVAFVLTLVMLGGGGKTSSDPDLGYIDSVDIDTLPAPPVIDATVTDTAVISVSDVETTTKTPASPAKSSTPTTPKKTSTSGSSGKTQTSTGGSSNGSTKKPKTVDDYFDNPKSKKSANDYFD